MPSIPEQLVNKSALAMPLNDLWTRICAELHHVVSSDAVERWFRPLEIERLENRVLTLRANNSIYQFWIEENYLPQLCGVASRLLDIKTLRVKFSAVRLPQGPPQP